MGQTPIIVGAVCVVAAIVGGGVKLAGNELPVIHSWLRQSLLAVFGAAMIAGGWWAQSQPSIPQSGQIGVTVANTVKTPTPAPTTAPTTPPTPASSEPKPQSAPGDASTGEPWKCVKQNAIIRRKIAPGDLATDPKGQRYVDLGGIQGSGDTALTGVVESAAALNVQFGYVHMVGSDRQFEPVNGGGAKSAIAFKFNVALADAGVAFPDGLSAKVTVNICRQPAP